MEMLDHYRTAELTNELISNAQNKAMYDLIELLKPELSIITTHQGTKGYCYDYKGLIVAGGESVYAAMCNFNAAFYKKL